MARIEQISYDVGGAFTVTVDDFGEVSEVVAADDGNRLAVDAAFERRALVVLEVDANNYIVRVQSEPAADEPEPPGSGVVITRIATQVQGGELITEVFFAEEPTGNESGARTKDSTVHLICHGAYLSKHRLKLTVDDGIITQVVKRLPGPV